MCGDTELMATMQGAPLDSFWCMWTVMQVSRLMRWMRVRSWRSVRPTISRSSASALRRARVTTPLSVLADISAAYTS